MKLEPKWIYKVDGEAAYLRLSNFHKSKTGAWLCLETPINKERVKIKMQACPECADGETWVTWLELEAAEWVIACDNCGALLPPAIYGGDHD
jgi:hypothetical protein